MSKQLVSFAAVAFLISVVAVSGQNPGAPEGGRGRGGADPVALPDGNGKDLVQTLCTKCHGLNLITNSWGYSRQGWETVFSSMVAVPKDQSHVVAEYLASHFPEKPRPRAVLVPGKASVTIKEWMVPSLGSRPHDPLAAADGSLWWTGQWANVLGRLDPKTGAIKEYPLKTKTPNPRPHGLTEDSAGNIWYTGNGNGTVGKLDPKTGLVTEYPMPDPAARDPHTPIFDQKGTLWFTLQQANMVGRLNPQTGDLKLVTMPTARSLPYGVPFLVLFGTNKVASLDPNTMAVREYTLPDSASRPRRIAIGADDIIWYADYSRGYLGRLDPSTGAVKEWPSPSGPQSQPYGISVANGIIWYSESAVSPNTIVRFDPKTEQFQTWAIPSGGGVVRNMMTTKDGDLVLACSGVNKVGLVDIR
jgi:virginiamycin B lyase